jgi:hypothetical protein
MLIFDNNSQPIIIDNITAPVVSDHFWVLDLMLRDFTLTPLNVLEEVVCPTVVLRVEGFDFAVPAGWNILVYDPETTQLDTVELSEAAGREFTALVYGPTLSTPRAGHVSVVDYFIEYKNVNPALNKHQMLCHPIGPNAWVNITPSDAYAKYLKDMSVSDLISF